MWAAALSRQNLPLGAPKAQPALLSKQHCAHCTYPVQTWRYNAARCGLCVNAALQVVNLYVFLTDLEIEILDLVFVILHPGDLRTHKISVCFIGSLSQVTSVSVCRLGQQEV